MLIFVCVHRLIKSALAKLLCFCLAAISMWSRKSMLDEFKHKICASSYN